MARHGANYALTNLLCWQTSCH